MSERPVAVVTGASTGIGEASARRSASDGFRVVCAARRVRRVAQLAAEIDGIGVGCDVTSAADVSELAEAAGSSVALLVNNAGGALGLDRLEVAPLELWRQMYETNALGMVAVTQALLPALRAAHGTIITITSIAADQTYEGGGGYCAAKAAERVLSDALRLELNGEPIRICDIAPGLTKTEEFALTRFGGDRDRADAVYAGVPEPLTAEDLAECVSWVAGLPHHVNVDRLLVRPLAQATTFKVNRQA
ncbi:MAG TPA: SDR family NAD(P)-dependent oxidoreductase [Dermatophilaceae bacterium]|nr:SDR family NAD(P)-dependent oxidoreductase [Dermatophilaceae bacterium]